MSKTFILSMMAALTLTLPAFADEKDDAIKLVDEVVAMLKKDGADKTLSEVNNPKTKWVKGELYPFVYKIDGTVVAHPLNAKLVGKNLLEQPDATGKLYRKEIMEKAKSPGTGWVDYMYKNPTSGKIEPKTTWIKKEGDFVICAGIYKK